MRTLTKTIAAVGLFWSMMFAAVTPLMAQGYYFGEPGVGVYVGRPYHPYYRHYGPEYYRPYRHYYGSGGECGPGWSLQGGVCKPYRYGPWDYYR